MSLSLLVIKKGHQLKVTFWPLTFLIFWRKGKEVYNHDAFGRSLVTYTGGVHTRVFLGGVRYFAKNESTFKIQTNVKI